MGLWPIRGFLMEYFMKQGVGGRSLAILFLIHYFKEFEAKSTALL